MKTEKLKFSEINRLIIEYSERDKRLEGKDIYSSYNQGSLFLSQQRYRVVSRLLIKNKLTQLNELMILELGCGKGGVLLEMLGLGAKYNCIFGVDILKNKLKEARFQLPKTPLLNADGQKLPLKGSKFSIVIQFTAFSSILDSDVKRNMASEMLRVLKNDGLIIWYDFWTNPINRQTKGIRKNEIKDLFPECTYNFHKITLAPPITRKLVHISWILCMFLEKIKILNTHYLVAIKKKQIN
jgi:ubiquinone/menaquinone biosynthesis C-methylase UbiE